MCIRGDLLFSVHLRNLYNQCIFFFVVNGCCDPLYDLCHCTDADSDARDGGVSCNGHEKGLARSEVAVPPGTSCDTVRRVIHDDNNYVHLIFAS